MLAMAREASAKSLEAKEMEIRRLKDAKKRAADSAATLQQSSENRVRELEARIDADRAAFQNERSQWSQLEADRDAACAGLAKQIEIGEACQKEVEQSEAELRKVQRDLEQEKLKRLDVERRMAETTAARATAESSRINAEQALRQCRDEFREVKEALAARGISMEFLIGRPAADEAATPGGISVETTPKRAPKKTASRARSARSPTRESSERMPPLEWLEPHPSLCYRCRSKSFRRKRARELGRLAQKQPRVSISKSFAHCC